jgi:hypothetical protein
MGLLDVFKRRSGVFSDELRSELAAESPLVLAERLGGTVVFRQYRAPGRYSSYKYEKFVRGLALAVTDRRVVVLAGWQFRLHLPRTALAQVEITVPEPEVLCIDVLDASLVDPRTSGRVTVTVRTPDAPRIAAAVSA